MKIKTISDMKDTAAKIRRSGVEHVVIKGGHLPGNKNTDVTDILYNGTGYCEFSSEKINARNTHGTGCTTLRRWRPVSPGKKRHGRCPAGENNRCHRHQRRSHSGKRLRIGQCFWRNILKNHAISEIA